MKAPVRTAAQEREQRDRTLRIALPIVVLALGVVAWELLVRIKDIQPYVLPAPSLIFQTFLSDWKVLSESLVVTLATTFEGFLLAAVGGVGLAVLFNQSRLVEYSLYPYAVILQVTPIVAVAPLLLIYLPQQAAVLTCAWIVAFFPVLANTTLGLHSVDRNLVDLFSLYGASRWQMLWDLKLPAAMPYILGGLRIAGGLSLDRRGGGGDRGRLGRRRLGPRLPHRRIRLPPQHPAHVRGAAAALGRRHRDLLPARAGQSPRAAALARERAGMQNCSPDERSAIRDRLAQALWPTPDFALLHPGYEGLPLLRRKG